MGLCTSHLDANSMLGFRHEKRKSLDLVCVKKRLEDYEHILQYYTFKRTKNKMKEFNT
jgi:hypothetical protein